MYNSGVKIKGKNFKKPSRSSLAFVGLKLIILGAVFSLGVGVGQGRVMFGSSGTTKTVQNNLPNNLSYGSAEEVYDVLKAKFDGSLDEQKLIDGLREGLAKATGDPYTEFLNEEDNQQFQEGLTGSFTGIGAELGKENDLITIIAPLQGFPAEKAGLRPRDIISKINGETAFDLSVSEAVKRIRGPKDTKVSLTVIRDESKELTFEITRDNITVPSVKYEILDNQIGYLQISRFGEDTKRLSQEAAQQFKNAKVRGVILDMRSNPGGLLEGAVDVSSLWLKNKTVLDERRDNVTIKTFKSNGSALLEGVPTVVLINEGSASASEIVAGALKDNQAATVVGKKSFGKGSVQELRNLRSGGVLKVTIARWFTPAGKNIDKEGIEPDTVVELTEEDITAKRDPQKDKALEILKK